MNSDGKIQNTNGKTIFTGAAKAFSWARWRRLTRISSACTRSTRAIVTPNASACIIASRNDRSSSRSVRSVRWRMASRRLTPTRVSWSIRKNSSESGPGDGLHDASEGRVETEARLDADHQQVERVRERFEHRLLAVVDVPLKPGVGAEETESGGPKMTSSASCRRRITDRPRRDDTQDRQDDLQQHERSGVDVAGIAGVDHLLLDVLQISDGCEATGQPAQTENYGAKARSAKPCCLIASSREVLALP
jgi:hypothetical protein